MVPNTLVRTASQTYCSRMGTCLCAAAWNTTSGRTRWNTASSTPRSRMSQSATFAAPPRACTASWRCVSSWSSSTSSAGPKRATWRATSAPIQPPPPVIRTRLPCSSVRIGAVSISTCCRPTRSAMSRARMSVSRGMPWAHDADGRSTRTGMSASSATSAILCTSVASAPVMASRIWLMAWSTIASGRSSIPQTIGTPWMVRQRSDESSSTTISGTRPIAVDCCISRIADAPACPAPTMATRVPPPRNVFRL